MNLKVQLEAQLDVTRVSRIGELAERSHVRQADRLTRIRRADVQVSCTRIRELGVIEDVETLKPQLSPDGFRELEVLEDREVPLVNAGAAEDIPSCVTQRAILRPRPDVRV